MKLEQALKYAQQIADKLNTIVGGQLETPGCRFDGVQFKKIYVFGSTVKGSQNPDDLDLVVVSKPFGDFHKPSRHNFERRFRRAFGITARPSSISFGNKWLTQGMRGVRCYETDTDPVNPVVKVEIWPQWRLTEHMKNLAPPDDNRKTESETTLESECPRG